MEAKINVVEILKDKPQGTKLYSILSDGECFLNEASEDSIYIDIDNRKRFWCFTVYGSTHSFPNGCVLLFPSREMRDWEKFSWKRGDVLMAGVDNICIFEKWDNEDYTEFKAIFATPNYSGATFKTEKWSKETNEAVIKQYISNIEKFKGGKLNLATLEIEKQPGFKDGDMVSLEIRYIDSEDVIVETYIVHGDYNYGEELNFYAGCNNLGMIKHNSCVKPTNTSVRKVFIRYATDSEKQQLFSALAKENKAWDSEKKDVVNLKPKVELKPFDKVLVRDSKFDIWRANLFGYIGKDGYYRCVYANWIYCIPYAGNEHLLGTAKDVEG
ncbi:hypothetical protein TTRE_0000961001 [Trichuris trichiura]|uniref:Uncharacterized protein n=1 Tax=Trichuris trichiura TaxID=36087 RepID=A0A077ZN84_TRITR|nr:hypothetical protein TTRE_0000961001 [Trichuris trichiura]